MAYFERTRDILSGLLTHELLRQRTDAGWRITSIEWRENSPATPQFASPVEDIPYGLRISEHCLRLELHPEQNRILRHMTELLVQDFPFTSGGSGGSLEFFEAWAIFPSDGR